MIADGLRPGLVEVSGGVPVASDRWLPYGDAMRVFGVVAVVLVHTCDMIVFSRRLGTTAWWVANVIDASGRWAVPVFIMLSGALLLDPSRGHSAGRFYRRRLARLGVAVVFWSVFYVLFGLYYTRWATPETVWKDLLQGKPYVHMHFVFRLAGLYAITPFLWVFVRHASLRVRATAVLVLLGLGMADSAASAFAGTAPSAFAILWPFLAFYLGGNVLREVKVTRQLAGWSCVGFAASAAGIAVGTGLIIPASHPKPVPFPSVDMMLYDFLSPLRVLLSVCAWFILAYAFGRVARGSRLQRILGALAPLTLGVYLVHPLFREILYVDGWRLVTPVRGEGGLLFTWPTFWTGIPLTFAAVTLASFGLTYVLSRIPLMKKVVG